MCAAHRERAAAKLRVRIRVRRCRLYGCLPLLEQLARLANEILAVAFICCSTLLLLRSEADFRREAVEFLLPPFPFLAGDCSAPPPNPSARFSRVDSETPSLPLAAVFRDLPPNHDATALRIPLLAFSDVGGLGETTCFVARHSKNVWGRRGGLFVKAWPLWLWACTHRGTVRAAGLACFPRWNEYIRALFTPDKRCDALPLSAVAQYWLVA